MIIRAMRAGVVLAALAGGPLAAQAAIFNGGNLVILEAQGTYASGTSGPINSLASSVSLREWTPGVGLTGNRVDLPSTGTGDRLTIAGSSTSEGQLTLSRDGRYLIMAGYNASFGQSGPNTGSSIATSTTANVNRMVGAVDLNGGVNLYHISDAFSTNNMRGAASVDGSSFYAVGSGSGLRQLNPPLTTTTQLNTGAGSPTNLRAVNVFDFGSGPQVYVSAASGTLQGVGLLNTGTGAIDLLPGFPTTSGPSPEDFVFASATTLYVSDDRAVASGGGLQRWDFNGGTGQWVLSYTLSSGLANGLRSVTLGANGQIYAIAGASSAGGPTSLVEVVDLGASSPFATLATSGAGTVWRGVEWIVPAPGTAGVLGLGLVVAGRRRRR